ncbi:DUF2637 domain-containing protein [Streptomyces sp. NPDC059165]|uniref:DUF2637 domain-containing protein n=1 Tax=Streptomyces sp. NPDC059165 TaxID=3346751 RepID=UPI0036831CD1
MQLTRTHRILIGVVVAGAVIIAGIGFAGSYAAVRELAEKKGFGNFSLVFPIGIDAGICVLLALDLLLTWIRIPFPLLRQTAWLLTAATIAFNGAAAWPDPLGVGMHAVIPVLFVVAVEAARHAVGRIADITADKHMEGVRLTRWLLSPVPTFRLWRRMKLWELRSYEQVIKLEQDRLIYQARLQARFGRAWRRKAPVEALMPLRLARYGVPLAETAPAGLSAAGIEPALLPPQPAKAPLAPPVLRGAEPAAGLPGAPAVRRDPPGPVQEQQLPDVPETHESPWFSAPHASQEHYEGGYDPSSDVEPAPAPEPYGAPSSPEPYAAPSSAGGEPAPPPFVPGPGSGAGAPVPVPRTERGPADEAAVPAPRPGNAAEPAAAAGEPSDLEDAEFAELAYPVFKEYVDRHGAFPTNDQLDIHLADVHGINHPRSASLLRRLNQDFQSRYQADLEAEHIA